MVRQLLCGGPEDDVIACAGGLASTHCKAEESRGKPSCQAANGNEWQYCGSAEYFLPCEPLSGHPHF